MSTQINIHPNTVTALLSHRVVDVTISVELGQLNLLMGERLYTLSNGHNITIPKNTPYAYATPSATQTIVTERIENPTFAKDIVVHADVDGVIYDINAAPTLQVSHSLYLCLVDMLVVPDVQEKLSA
ncbi:MAG: hypothetical protein A3J37_00185 [Alphaproteobacteria bacterium RIFCSPHIGHO2_12_FULL_45_9]|nr:MAG: hypothetical protein A3J37_00185 [Alphaproteobacteria bacterium RIFCSPHIGHO2_12_FULL_45_9]